MKKVNIILITCIFFIINVALATSWYDMTQDYSFSTTYNNVTYVIPASGMNATTITWGDYCVNITGGLYAGNYCDASSIPITVSLISGNSTGFYLITPNSSNSNALSYNITWNNAISPSNFSFTYNVVIRFTNSTVLLNTTTTNNFYLWNNTNETIGSYQIYVDAIENHTNNTQNDMSTLLIKPIQDYFRIYAYNYLGLSLIASMETYNNHTNSTINGNPYEILYSALLNQYQENRSFVINITDLTYKHRDYGNIFNISRTMMNYSINLTSNQLTFAFYQNGVLKTTEGFVDDENKTYGFNASNYVVIQQNLTEGYVHCRFNSINGINWTQYYEYYNDHETHISEEIEILENADWTGYFRVLDSTSAPIKDAKIRVYSSVGNLSGVSFKDFFGQRLTDDKGYTFFYFDQRAVVLFEISKEGYEPITALINVGDDSYTYNNPRDFYMQPSSSSNTDPFAWVTIRRTINNETLSINGIISAPNKELVQITTDYRIAQGLGLKTLTVDNYDKYDFNISDGTDFDLNQQTDVELYVYLDNVLWDIITIEYVVNDSERIFNLEESLMTNFLVGAFIIIIAIASGLIFKSATAGKWGFIIAGIMSGFISSSFLWVSLICVMYPIFLIAKKVISE